MAQSLGAARFPIDALYVVGQDYAAYAMASRNSHFERVPFRLIGDWAYQRETRFRIIDSRTQHQCRAPSCLFAARLGVER